MQAHDGIVRYHGSSYYLKNGQAHKIDKEVKLSEGITAEKDGKITLKDGTEMTLDEGKMVTLDGKVVETPPQVSSKLGESTSGSTSGSSSGGGSSSSSSGGSSGSSTQP